MPIIKKPFVCYDIANKVKGPLPVKLNEDDELMLSIAMYMFNLDSKAFINIDELHWTRPL